MQGPEVQPVNVAVVHVMPFLKYPEVREAGRAIVQRYADKLAKAGFQVQEAPKLGKPAEEILKAAKAHKADLIVTGAKGLGANGRQKVHDTRVQDNRERVAVKGEFLDRDVPAVRPRGANRVVFRNGRSLSGGREKSENAGHDAHAADANT